MNDFSSIARHPLWLERLQEAVDGYRARAFDDVTSNCLVYARDIVIAVTDIDPLRRLGVSEVDMLDPVRSRRLVVASGGIVELVSSALGPLLPPLAARIGDLCYTDEDGRISVGVCDGPGVIYLHTEAGLAHRALSGACGCWGVGA